MGIRGLQSYMERSCPNGCRTVQISDLIRDFRRSNKSDPLIIAMDGPCCINKFYDDLCWVLSGQWTELVESIRRFVDKFRQLGIELVVFFDGLTKQSKRTTWLKRRLEDSRDVEEIFHQIQIGRKEIDEKLFQLPAGMQTLVRFAFKFVCGCRVFTSCVENDQEVSTFAKENKCLAILGQDSDYIVSDTVPYLSINHLNLNRMTTVLYDRKALALHLGLRVDQLALLACLRGNDEICTDSLKAFHNNICRRSDNFNFHVIVQPIAKFIRENAAGHRIDLMLVAQKVFGTTAKTELLRKSLETYSVHKRDSKPPTDGFWSHDERLMDLARKKHENCDNLPNVYMLMSMGEFDGTANLEDCGRPNDCGLPPCALLFRPVRRRMYSLLRPDGGVDGRRSTVKEWCFYPGDKMPMPDQVTPLPFLLSSGGSTSLSELWSNASSMLRWEAFLACSGVRIEAKSLCDLPERFVVPSCIVNFLIQNASLFSWEVDALVAHFVILSSCDLNFLNNLRLDPLNIRAVHLASLFMRGVATMLNVSSVCGHPFSLSESMPWFYFNGKLLHRCYVRAKNNPNKINCFIDPREDVQMNRDLFHRLKSICVEKTKMSSRN